MVDPAIPDPERRSDAVISDLVQSITRDYVRQENNLTKQVGDGGVVGMWIGKLEYQAGNIALITIVGLLLILLLSIAGLIGIDANQKEGLGKIEDLKSIILAILGLTGTILGYIFGKSSASHGEPGPRDQPGPPKG